MLTRTLSSNSWLSNALLRLEMTVEKTPNVRESMVSSTTAMTFMMSVRFLK